jgi:AhpD family alkylhydroperoxidase
MRPASRFILTIRSSFYQAAPPSRYFHDNLAGTTEVKIKISARTSHREMPARHDIGNNRRKPIMTTKIDLFAAAPSLMTVWQRTSIELDAAASFDRTLSELLKLRASEINGCANCLNLRWKRAKMAKPSSASPCCRPGGKRLATPTESARHLAGPRPHTPLRRTGACERL